MRDVPIDAHGGVHHNTWMKCTDLTSSQLEIPQTDEGPIHTYIHTLHYITVHYNTLQYITSHYITLRYITLHYITYVHTYLISLSIHNVFQDTAMCFQEVFCSKCAAPGLHE